MTRLSVTDGLYKCLHNSTLHNFFYGCKRGK
jgi:hypothetical protein